MVGSGTRFGYHANAFGFLLGETLRRATGEPISALLRSHLTGPLGVADLDSEIAVGIMRNRFGDLTTAARIDQLVMDELA